MPICVWQKQRKRRQTFFLILLLSLATKPAAAAAIDPWVYAFVGLDHFYNLEYEDALKNFRQALTLDEENPIFLNYLANTYLFQELYRMGRLESRLYTESNAFLKEEKPRPDPAAVETFQEHLGRSKEICTQRLKNDPRDKTALYAMGIAHALEGTYEFTLAKRWFAALKAGSRAKEYHERLKRLDPDYHDADLVLGIYEYAVGSIPAAVRWLAALAGYRGSKERGITLLHSAISKGPLTSTNATVLLAVIHMREKRYAYTRVLLEKLVEYFPRNYLLPLEIAQTYLREGNDLAALERYAQVAQRTETSAPGYGRVPKDRLYYQIGSLQQRLRNYEQALASFDKITSTAEADGLVTAFARVRRGEIFLVQNRPKEVRQECERVLALPYAEPRAQAQQLLARLGKRQP